GMAHIAKGEDVQAIDRHVAVLARGQCSDQLVGRGFYQNPRESGVTSGECTQRVAYTAAERNLGERRHTGGSGQTDAYGAKEAAGSKRCDPALDRFRFPHIPGISLLIDPASKARTCGEARP